MINANDSSSQRPYLIRALYEWCTDNSLTPYVAVQVDDSVQVPREYVKNGEIVLNISFDATSALSLGNDFIEFKARFGGAAREIRVPIERVTAVYARENGQGMAFPASPPQDSKDKVARPPQPAPAAVAPRASLREAGRDFSEPKAGMHLVAVEPSAEASVADLTPLGAVGSSGQDDANSDSFDPSEPPRPPAGAGIRPALKRIK